jgi:hypothetical protein
MIRLRLGLQLELAAAFNWESLCFVGAGLDLTLPVFPIY